MEVQRDTGILAGRTMTQPQQHCDHECVCPDYKASHSENGEDECYGDPDPCSLSCYHRSRPYQSERDKVLDEKLASQYKTILMQCMDGMEEIRSKYSIAQKSCKSCSAYDLCEELRQAGEP